MLQTCHHGKEKAQFEHAPIYCNQGFNFWPFVFFISVSLALWKNMLPTCSLEASLQKWQHYPNDLLIH